MPVGLVSPSVIQYNSLDFVRSGAVFLKHGTMRYLSFHGRIWSQSSGSYTSTTDTYAHNLFFDSSGINPSIIDYRWYGLPVRCLVYKLTGRSKYLRSRSSGRTRRFSAPALQRQALATRAEYLRYLLLHY